MKKIIFARKDQAKGATRSLASSTVLLYRQRMPVRTAKMIEVRVEVFPRLSRARMDRTNDPQAVSGHVVTIYMPVMINLDSQY